MSIGTLSVNGDLVLESGSVLQMEVSPVGADRINVSGAARLGGTLEVNPVSGTYLFNSSHTLVSGGTVTGGFGAISGLGGFGSAFDPIVTQTGQAVLLRLRPASLVTLAGPAAGSNGSAVAAAFDRAAQADYNPQPFFTLYTQGANLANALEQLSGEVHSVERRVALEDTRVVREAAFDRINSAAINPTALQTATIGNGEKQATIWLRGLGNWSTAKTDGHGAGFTTEQQGILAGIDTVLSSDIKIGAMLISTKTDINVTSFGRSRVNNTGGAFYAGFQTKDFNFALGASYADTDMVANRSITIPGLQQSLRSETSGKTAQLMSRNDSMVPIYALTPLVETRRRVTLFRGVYPVNFAVKSKDPEETLNAAEDELLKRGAVQVGDLIIITIGEPFGKAGGTNTMKIVRVGEHRKP
jgi:outer membrane autotransporter protein